MNLDDRSIICLMSFNAFNCSSELLILKVLCFSKLDEKLNTANKNLKLMKQILARNNYRNASKTGIRWHFHNLCFNRGVRTTANLLNHMDTLIFHLAPSKIFINIGFNIPEDIFLANYDEPAIRAIVPQDVKPFWVPVLFESCMSSSY